MSRYLIVGAGPIGRAVAQNLVTDGHTVTVVTRHGSGPEGPSINRVALDAADAVTLSALADGCAALFNCANPAYHRWPTDWPPIARALLAAAQSSGTVLTTLSNLYPYGAPREPMSPESPFLADYEKAKVRAAMWRDALQAHDDGRVRATEVRASDFIGPGAQSVPAMFLPRVLAGKRCWALGASDQPHSWTYTGDVATTLVTCADTPEAWGRAWHVPTNAARTQRELVDDLADAARVKRVPVSTIPGAAIRVLGLFNATVRELPTTMYQFTAPFIIDDSATRLALGLAPTPWPEVLAGTLASTTSATTP